MRPALLLAASALLLGVSAAARADPVPPPGERVLGPYHRRPWAPGGREEERPDYERLSNPSTHRHDGIYFRFAGGVGLGLDFAEATSDYFARPGYGDGKSYSGTADTFGGATEVAFGYTVTHGLALGAGVYTATLNRPRATGTGVGGGDYRFEISQLALFCPMLDFYPMPSRGLHVQAGVGLGTYVAGTGRPLSYGSALHAHSATGTGFVLGAGYEWWLSDEWGVGALVRLVRSGTDATDANGVAWSHTTTSYALLLSATYN
ncbi:MAG: hypothetical protein OZ921_14530 [Sorangiineae bacterium]|nr:hypothetical protein [Polyangiaceae bacterium]MEB2323724.1 hypothetical protein [Sorangiineae bacterium]